MSYYICDGCGKKHYIYGESNLEKTAKELKIEHSAEIPIMPDAAKKCDEGKIEELNVTEINEFFNKIIK